jgi:hypothetical protein
VFSQLKQKGRTLPALSFYPEDHLSYTAPLLLLRKNTGGSPDFQGDSFSFK